MIDLNDAPPQADAPPPGRRRVSWRTIKEVVKGRETGVLDALSIDWRSPETHITCPYPGHVDHNPSWRWDAAVARARCSCDSSASIFDVIMKVRDVDFSEACVIAAEMIGRDDLIGANDSAAGLTLDEYAAAKRFSRDWLNSIGVREQPAYGPSKAPAVRTEYRRLNGDPPSVRFRVNLTGDKKSGTSGARATRLASTAVSGRRACRPPATLSSSKVRATHRRFGCTISPRWACRGPMHGTRNVTRRSWKASRSSIS